MTDNPSYKLAKRIVIGVIGFTLLLLGLIMSIPMVPGPGFLVVLGALAILAAEFVWARRLLGRVKRGGVFMRRKFPIFRRKKNPPR